MTIADFSLSVESSPRSSHIETSVPPGLTRWRQNARFCEIDISFWMDSMDFYVFPWISMDFYRCVKFWTGSMS